MVKIKLTYILGLFAMLVATYVVAAEKIMNLPGTTPDWVGSDICFKSGDKLTLIASGSIAHSYNSWGPNDKDYHGPEGKPPSSSDGVWNGDSKWVNDYTKDSDDTGWSNPPKLRRPHSSSCNVAALVAKIGSSKVRCVGTKISGEIKSSGELKVAINSSFNQNSKGSFQVSIQGGHLCEGDSNDKNTW